MSGQRVGAVVLAVGVVATLVIVWIVATADAPPPPPVDAGQQSAQPWGETRTKIEELEDRLRTGDDSARLHNLISELTLRAETLTYEMEELLTADGSPTSEARQAEILAEIEAIEEALSADLPTDLDEPDSGTP